MLYSLHPNYTTKMLLGMEAATDFETKQPVVKDGKQIAVYTVALLGDRKPEVVTVKAPAAEGLAVGQSVEFINFLARPWENNGKSGVAHSAEAVKAAK
jgi:hypothetical protein